MKKILWLLVLLSLATAGYVAAGPHITILEIKTGIAERDSGKLSENIEFPRLRQNMKAQFNAEIAGQIPIEMQDNPFAAFGTALASKMVDGLVEALVTPEGLAKAMQGKRPKSSPDSDRTPRSDGKKEQKDDVFHNARYSYDSLTAFSIWMPNEDGTETRFILERQGISWKLVNIVMPLGE